MIFQLLLSSRTEKIETIFGAGQVHGILAVQLRCYVYDGDTADIADECERLADQIEDAIDTFSAANRALEVEEARVATLRTDDGTYDTLWNS